MIQRLFRGGKIQKKKKRHELTDRQTDREALRQTETYTHT